MSTTSGNTKNKLDSEAALRRPSIGDHVCGSFHVPWGKGLEVIDLFGKLTGFDDRPSVYVRFDRFEHVHAVDGEKKTDVADCLGVDIAIRAACIEWNDRRGCWECELGESPKELLRTSLVESRPADMRDEANAERAVGSEVRVNITHGNLRHALLAEVFEFIGVVIARWTDADGTLWAIVRIDRDSQSADADQANKFLGCLFLARLHTSKDLGLYRAVLAADDKAERAVSEVEREMWRDLDIIRELDWLDFQDKQRG